MAFVKIDTKTLTSTIWKDEIGWRLFEAAMLQAEPYEILEAEPQLKTQAMEETGWSVPPGWYGFARISGPWLLAQSSASEDEKWAALDRLSSPEPTSRSAKFEGRRLVRVDGGYIVLNYIHYRDIDHSSTVRMRRFRDRRRASPTVTVTSHPSPVTHSREQRAESIRTDVILHGPVGEESSGTAVPAKQPSWSKEVCDDWIERFGGTAPGGQIGKALKPLVTKHGAARVRAAWRNYLEQSDAQYASAARFASTFAQWGSVAPAEPVVPAVKLPPRDEDAVQFFDAIRLRLSGVIPPHNFVTWFRPVNGRCWEEGSNGHRVLVIEVPGPHHAQQMRFYADRLRAEASALGREIGFRTIVVPPDG